MIRFRHLEIFQAIMAQGSVSAAALHLGISQPSVTKTLQALETELGYRLFDRVKGRLQPTEEARVLLLEVERARAALEDVRSLARNLRLGRDSLLRVTATPALGREVLPDAVARFREIYPRSLFDITTHHSGEILSALARPSAGFDIGFTFGADDAGAAVGSVEIGTVSVACVARAGQLEVFPGTIALEDIAGLRIISLEESEPLGRMLAERARRLGLKLETSVRVQTYALACALAERGVGLAIVDAMTASGHARHNPGVDVRRFRTDDLSLPVTALYPMARGLPIATRRFIDCFSGALAERHAHFATGGK